MLLAVFVANVSWTYRNVLEVWAKGKNSLLVEGKLTDLSQLSEIVKLWILNPEYEDCYPEKRIEEVPFFGTGEVSKTVVSIQCDRDTEYGFYLAVQNEIEKAYNELRQELAMKKFGEHYYELSLDKKKAVNTVYPKRISEAEPNWILNIHGELVRNSQCYWW